MLGKLQSNSNTDNKISEEIRKLWELGYNLDDFDILMKLNYSNIGVTYYFQSDFGEIAMRHSEILKNNEFLIVPAAYTPKPKVCKCCGQVLPK